MVIEIILSLFMITSIPLGILLSKLLKDESDLTKLYFPPTLWILAIATAIFLAIDVHYALTTGYLFFMILSWLKFSN